MLNRVSNAYYSLLKVLLKELTKSTNIINIFREANLNPKIFIFKRKNKVYLDLIRHILAIK